MVMKIPKILIVEDDNPIRELYKYKLSLAGYDIRVAVDGNDGLKQAKDFMPDLIMLDLKMPNKSGDEMLRELRSWSWGKDMLVIILTNISKTEAPMDMRLLNVNQYIVKVHYTPKKARTTEEMVLFIL